MPNPTVERFDADPMRDGLGVYVEMRKADDSEFVRFSDYSALQSECERLRAAVKSKEPTCGWEKFYALVIGEFAHLARNLIEGEVLTYDLREHVMILGDYAKTAAGALRAASAIDAALAQSAKGE